MNASIDCLVLWLHVVLSFSELIYTLEIFVLTNMIVHIWVTDYPQITTSGWMNHSCPVRDFRFETTLWRKHILPVITQIKISVRRTFQQTILTIVQWACGAVVKGQFQEYFNWSQIRPKCISCCSFCDTPCEWHAPHQVPEENIAPLLSELYLDPVIITVWSYTSTQEALLCIMSNPCTEF